MLRSGMIGEADSFDIPYPADTDLSRFVYSGEFDGSSETS